MEEKKKIPYLSVQEKAEEFLNKRDTEIECIPVEDIQLLVSDLVRCLNTLSETGSQQENSPAARQKPDRGSLSINEKGFIINADNNVARMLGKDRQSLKKHRIQNFIDRKFKKRFNQHYLDACQRRTEQNCLIKFVTAEGGHFLASLNSIPRFDDKGSFIELDSSVRFSWETL